MEQHAYENDHRQERQHGWGRKSEGGRSGEHGARHGHHGEGHEAHEFHGDHELRGGRWERHHGGSGERGHGGGERRSGGRRGGGRGRSGYTPLVQEEGAHLLMIGSWSCTRHKGEERMALQQAGKLSFLCLQEIDWITGDYLPQIEAAAAEVVKEFGVRKLILFGGCQVELQSLDTKMLTEGLTAQLGIPVEFHRGCHLVGYGNDLREGRTE